MTDFKRAQCRRSFRHDEKDVAVRAFDDPVRHFTHSILLNEASFMAVPQGGFAASPWR
ncbi:MAG TPA: hypothetical protein PKH09_05795 [Parvularculaceae bacterium]|nr:hypothetical protein [Parvularculaceae bacterium]